MIPFKSTQVNLTPAQYSRLLILEADERIRVVGHFSGCPIISHYGTGGDNRPTRQTPALAYLSPGGRLRGLGKTQEQESVIG